MVERQLHGSLQRQDFRIGPPLEAHLPVPMPHKTLPESVSLSGHVKLGEDSESVYCTITGPQ